MKYLKYILLGSPLLAIAFFFPPIAASAYELAGNTLFKQASTSAYYKMENANDSMFRGFTLTNDNTVTFTSGKYTLAADYSTANTNKCLRRDEDSPSGLTYAQFGTAWSISSWVYEQTQGAGGNAPWGFQVQAAGNGRRNATLLSTSGALSLSIFDGVSSNFIPGRNLPLNTWTHIVITYDGTNIRFYINAILVGRWPYTAPGLNFSAEAGGIGIGCGRQNNTSVNFWSGREDDFAIYTKTLSPVEIQNLFGLQMFFHDF